MAIENNFKVVPIQIVLKLEIYKSTRRYLYFRSDSFSYSICALILNNLNMIKSLFMADNLNFVFVLRVQCLSRDVTTSIFSDWYRIFSLRIEYIIENDCSLWTVLIVFHCNIDSPIDNINRYIKMVCPTHIIDKNIFIIIVEIRVEEWMFSQCYWSLFAGNYNLLLHRRITFNRN